MNIKKYFNSFSTRLSKLAKWIHGSKIEHNSDLLRFTPLRYLIIAYLLFVTVYFFTECYPVDYNGLKDTYLKISKDHQLLVVSFQTFLASLAFFVAWQRSIVSDKTLTIQQENQNLDRYYSMKTHFNELVDEHLRTDYGEIIKRDAISSVKLFNSFFQSPLHGNFNMSTAFKRSSEILIHAIHLNAENSNLDIEDSNLFDGAERFLQLCGINDDVHEEISQNHIATKNFFEHFVFLLRSVTDELPIGFLAHSKNMTAFNNLESKLSSKNEFGL
jgi:uncharacterized protein YifN (PemK superfamily)